jgi:protein phosphatase
MRLAAEACTHVGLRREANEDAYLVDLERGLVAVADGMGGHAAGEVASRLAIETLQSSLEATAAGDGPEEAEQALVRAIQAANQRIAEEIQTRDSLRGMGTTLVAALCHGEHLVVAHVGDSRAYLVRSKTIERLTTDHSWVNEQVQLGILSEEEAHRHPFRNVITRALGSADPVAVDAMRRTLREGDTLLLCSDGLNGLVADEVILERVLAAGDDLDRAARSLVDEANAAGGDDNVTVVLLSLRGESEGGGSPA